MTGTIRTIMDDALVASFDPAQMYRSGLRTLLQVMEGKLDNISPMNPVVLAIEHQAALIAAFVESSAADNQRLLQVAAQNKEDLYPHMSDIHFTNIFNLPSRSMFTLVLSKTEVLHAMKSIPGTHSKKVMIPRNSYFTIAGYEFGIHYPINIVQQLHGGIHVTYDTSKPTVLQKLKSNMLDWRTVSRDGVEYIAIDIPVFQFKIASKTPVVTAGSTFNHRILLEDKYYACRIYRTLTSGEEVEMNLTYSEEVYDPQKPTAVVKVLENEIVVTIPQIYITAGQVIGQLRIDVYTTKGPLETRFDNYQIGSTSFRVRDLFKRADTTYTDPVSKFGTVVVVGEQIVTGGANAMTFTELRDVVIADGIGDPNLPITPAQIQNFLSRRGYDIVKNMDLVTDRVFLATRNLPEPSSTGLITAANATIETINTSFQELILNSAVIDNGSSVTITPNAVYQLNGGLLKMLSDSELATVRNMRSDLLASHVTNGNYLYTPYHYVLDRTTNQFRFTPYYLAKPKVDSQSFDRDNESTQLTVGTNGYTLEKLETGYKLQLTTRSSAEYQELEDEDCVALLRFTAPTEDDPAWLKGTLVGVTSSKERIFEFNIQSRFSMNEFDRIDFRNFKMYDEGDKVIYADLEQMFKVMYCTTAKLNEDYEPSEMDKLLPSYVVTPNTVAITEESLVLNFGSVLRNLWARARSVASTLSYETYPTNVTLRYKEDVYKKDPQSGSDITWENGLPVKVLLHSKGDPILDIDGNEQIQFPKGTVVLDPITGLPIVKDARYLKHRFELFLIEGVYIFSNDQIAIDYREGIADTVANWVTEDLADIETVTMDKSRAYFYPKTVFGTVDVIAADGVIQQIYAAQHFDVALSVPLEVMQNPELLKQLRTQTVRVIADSMNNVVLANSDMVLAAKAAYAGDVTDVQISLFGDLANIPVMQLVNEVHRCGIRKRLVSRDDDKLIVEEDVTITFQTIQ